MMICISIIENYNHGENELAPTSMAMETKVIK